MGGLNRCLWVNHERLICNSRMAVRSAARLLTFLFCDRKSIPFHFGFLLFGSYFEPFRFGIIFDSPIFIPFNLRLIFRDPNFISHRLGMENICLKFVYESRPFYIRFLLKIICHGENSTSLKYRHLIAQFHVSTLVSP